MGSFLNNQFWIWSFFRDDSDSDSDDDDDDNDSLIFNADYDDDDEEKVKINKLFKLYLSIMYTFKKILWKHVLKNIKFIIKKKLFWFISYLNII